MSRLQAVVLGLILLPLCGCNTDKINSLEKQNAALKSQLAKEKDTARDFDLQAKCSKDARTWFNENWSRDKDTILLDYSNQYNAQHNKCFILVELHYNSHFADPGGQSWTNDMTLMDVYENARYAHIAENHITNLKPTLNVTNDVITCDVQGQKCKTGDDFDNLIRPYMNN